MAQIGGDFFDILEPDTGSLGILVADVTGHGIHAALLSFMSVMVFRNVAPGRRATADVLHAVNDALFGKLHDGNFVAMYYAILDAATHRLTFAQAGTPPALLVRPRTGKVIPLETKSTVIGLLPTVRLEEKRIALEPGDKVLFYTDAIIESANEEGEMLGIAGLQRFLAQHSNLPIDALLHRVYTLGQQHSGKDGYEDDFTLVGLQLAD
jgi:serine phosphatase RsbU (regulator of sigma subunit)